MLIATQGPAERLTTAVRQTHALTLEAWVTPARTVQAGPARIVTLSQNHTARNFTLGQEENIYEMRLRTTATSANGLPSLQTGAVADASIGAARSRERDCAVVFVSRGGLVRVDRDQLKSGLRAEWFDIRTTKRRAASPREDGVFQPPSRDNWVLVLR